MDLMKLSVSFNSEDISQIAIGAFALAVPVAFSEEAWKLGETLPTVNLLMILGLSLIFLSFYTYQSIFQANIQYRTSVFILRIFISYLIALFVVALVLFSLNKFPIMIDPLLAFKRLVVVGMPASMGAIIVDSFDKE